MKLGHECGLFGVHGDPEAVAMVYHGLQVLQHRGQEGAGIASTWGGVIRHHAAPGLVTQAFSDPAVLERIRNPIAIGHVRYATTGGSLDPTNVQPLLARFAGGPVALAHNGDLTNKAALRAELEAAGALFQSTMDSETVLHLLARSGETEVEQGLRRVLPRLEGAYCLLMLVSGKLVALRDPLGFRPLYLARRGRAWMVASEDAAFHLWDGIEDVREIEPGEMVVIDERGPTSLRFAAPRARIARCIFETIYFARPDSHLFGRNVHLTRVAFGHRLAREHPVPADIVSAVPDSGNSASIGYSRESGIPLDRAFIKNHYVGRTFITPGQEARQVKVRMKLAAVREVVEGKRVVVVDDSIIRGTTSSSRIAALRQAGAREVHLRISCPPTRHPCFFGIDFPTPDELIAANMSVEETARFVGADTLGYLSEEGLVACVEGARDTWCLACFDGDYPAPTPGDFLSGDSPPPA
ncbi:MAG: amidophosphoribosyltransferase [Planctomycetota bacterium]